MQPYGRVGPDWAGVCSSTEEWGLTGVCSPGGDGLDDEIKQYITRAMLHFEAILQVRACPNLCHCLSESVPVQCMSELVPVLCMSKSIPMQYMSESVPVQRMSKSLSVQFCPRRGCQLFDERSHWSRGEGTRALLQLAPVHHAFRLSLSLCQCLCLCWRLWWRQLYNIHRGWVAGAAV